LTGQTFSVMSGVATDEQIPLIFAAAKKYLQDKKRGGFRLNTDFGGEQHDLGRAFSFVYGEKENGAVFSHMAVMFANGLYRRGFVKEGFEVIDSLRRMSVETAESRIYPCLPEYFNAEGRGMYSYLTGSASWLMLTYLTEIFGVRGERGDLRIEPKLVKKQFGSRNEISVRLTFAGKKITVRFLNKAGKEYGEYIIVAAAINGSPLAAGSKSITIPRNDLLKKATRSSNIIEIVLG
jgi:cellobiose phosphorylase